MNRARRFRQLIPPRFPTAMGRLAFAAILVGCMTPLPAAEPTQVDVYTAGQNGYHTYRIPSLLVTRGGALLAFCEGRKTGRSDHGDLDLVVRRSTDNGRTWSDVQVVYEEGGERKITIGNPCPVVDQSSGTIWLPFTRDNDDVLLTHSTDDGQTWSAPVVITADVKRPGWSWYATGPGVGIQLTRGQHAGRLVIPCDHREKMDGRDVKLSHVFYSDDAGESWHLGDSVARHTDECQVVELNDGRLMINMRNYWQREGGQPEKGGMRAVALSNDGGQTWGPLRFDQTLIEPVCQASFTRYTVPPADDERNVLLFSNPASKTKREQMTVRASFDEGQSWPVSKTLYPGSSAYSCLATLPDGRIGLLYERDDYGRISLAMFTMDWLAGERDTISR